MKVNKLLAITVLAILAAAKTASPLDNCDLASKVADKAHKAFQKDMVEGLKLFIKAGEICPETEYTYNLGIAYYKYGRLPEAEQYLRKALAEKEGKSSWHNNLAEVLLDRNNEKEALEHAETAYRLQTSARNADTLSRACLAAGNYKTALTVIHRARIKWVNEERLKRTYNLVLDKYISHYLYQLKAGSVGPALSGLSEVDYDVRGLRAYCLALAATGKLDQAIRTADSAMERFPELSETLGRLLDHKIRYFYETFKYDRPDQAIEEAKSFSEKYPGSTRAREAYQELFEAFLADASTIEIPEPTLTTGSQNTGLNTAEELLSGLNNDFPLKKAGLDPTVDIEKDIPKGGIKRPSGVAVIIGNQHYSRQNRGIMDVKFAERDAFVMKKYLVTTMGFNPEDIIYRIDVTSGDLRNIFGSRDNPRGMLHNYVGSSGKKSEIFIYYAGHGAPDPDGNSAYLVPVDASPDYIRNTGYDLNFFYKILADLPVREITVVLDACFSGDSAAGPLFSNISPAMVKTSNPVRELKNAVVFAGADQDQVCTWYPAKRHSLFTYFFLKGLGGEADVNRDKTITALELGGYLGEEVPHWARREANRRQTPLIRGRMDTVLTRLE